MFSFGTFIGVREWVRENYRGIVTFFGCILVGILAFQSGFLYANLSSVDPIVVRIPTAVQDETPQNAPVDDRSEKESSSSVADAAKNSEKCPFVGSRNSDKYHLAKCAIVKRIKSENRVCFTSGEDARSRGYIPGCTE